MATRRGLTGITALDDSIDDGSDYSDPGGDTGNPPSESDFPPNEDPGPSAPGEGTPESPFSSGTEEPAPTPDWEGPIDQTPPPWQGPVDQPTPGGSSFPGGPSAPGPTGPTRKPAPGGGAPPADPAKGGGVDIGALLKALGGPLAALISGLLAPHRQSFSGTAVDPVRMLSQYKTGLDGMIGDLTKSYHSGVQLPGATVQTPFNISGGALPFDIGVSGQDPMQGGVPSLQPGGQPGVQRTNPGGPTPPGSEADKQQGLQILRMLGIQ